MVYYGVGSRVVLVLAYTRVSLKCVCASVEHTSSSRRQSDEISNYRRKALLGFGGLGVQCL